MDIQQIYGTKPVQNGETVDTIEYTTYCFGYRPDKGPVELPSWTPVHVIDWYCSYLADVLWEALEAKVNQWPLRVNVNHWRTIQDYCKKPGQANEK